MTSNDKVIMFKISEIKVIMGESGIKK